ncbi:Large ribosomal subunit protein uL22c [Cardamine amara subsp. amara]|uniref:Large ribosomal subunit protein uL22c n=1 Tax=Cardamine amara subsp. amara TaxID=228776 RepID=A0ABD1BXH1_CARAN
MAGWQRNLQLVIRQVGTSVKKSHISTANYSSTRNLESPFSQGYLQSLLRPTHSTRSLYHYLQQSGISTAKTLLAGEEPVSSPLSSPALLGSGKEEEQKIIPKREKVQAVLKAIKQSPKKVNLVAALVRGMRVEDALLQLQVTVKRASQTVYRVIHAARANASHNHGLDPDRLLVAEAFVGKGLFKKRISYHGKGKCGLMERPECRLTVIVREMTPEEEAEIARLKVHNFKKLSKRERRLVPHKLIETTPIWNRKGTKANRHSSELVLY